MRNRCVKSVLVDSNKVQQSIYYLIMPAVPANGCVIACHYFFVLLQNLHVHLNFVSLI